MGRGISAGYPEINIRHEHVRSCEIRLERVTKQIIRSTVKSYSAHLFLKPHSKSSVAASSRLGTVHNRDRIPRCFCLPPLDSYKGGQLWQNPRAIRRAQDATGPE